jgi:hypothetical protein
MVRHLRQAGVRVEAGQRPPSRMLCGGGSLARDWRQSLILTNPINTATDVVWPREAMLAYQDLLIGESSNVGW